MPVILDYPVLVRERIKLVQIEAAVGFLDLVIHPNIEVRVSSFHSPGLSLLARDLHAAISALTLRFVGGCRSEHVDAGKSQA